MTNKTNQENLFFTHGGYRIFEARRFYGKTISEKK